MPTCSFPYAYVSACTILPNFLRFSLKFTIAIFIRNSSSFLPLRPCVKGLNIKTKPNLPAYAGHGSTHRTHFDYFAKLQQYFIEFSYIGLCNLFPSVIVLILTKLVVILSATETTWYGKVDFTDNQKNIQGENKKILVSGFINIIVSCTINRTGTNLGCWNTINPIDRAFFNYL